VIRVAAVMLVLVACGDDSGEERRARKPRAEAELDAIRAEKKAIELRRKTAELALIEADGKHWYDLPKRDQLGPGLRDCERYLEVIRKYLTCTSVSDDMRKAMTESIDAMRQGWTSISPDSADYINESCRTGITGIVDMALMNGCSVTIPPP
jgi:hypothetical protein